MNAKYLLLSTLALSFWAGSAEAASGFADGRIRFFNRNGGFCPAAQNCTGATYLQSSYNTYLGIPEAKVRLVRSSDGVTIGSGVTDANGNYVMSWSSPGAGNISAQIRVIFEQKDTRFRFRTTGDAAATAISFAFMLNNGTTSNSPQNVSWDWGTAGSPNAFANAYWAAWKLWNHRLKTSNRMLAGFDDLDIYGFSDTAPCSGGDCADCGTSCASGFFELGGGPAWANANKTIVLDADAAFNPQERVMHEMGHIADYVSGDYRFSTGYGYNGGNSWSFTTAEYRPSALHEGLASFIGSSGFYHGQAENPRTCFGGEGQHCYPGGTGGSQQAIETSNDGSCAQLEGRFAISHTRFFWDIYDSIEDGRDEIDLAIHNIFDSIAATPCPNAPACYGAGEAHDPYSFVSGDLAQRTVSCTDCGHAWDFRANMLNVYSGGFDVQDQYFNNCLGFFN
jgi:hypothetical protein